MGTKIGAINRIVNPVRNTVARARKNKFINSIYQECTSAQVAFVDARKNARSGGNNQIKSLTKGVTAFAKEVGPIPFTTAAAGFCFLPIGGTTTGLITGLLAKRGFKFIQSLVRS